MAFKAGDKIKQYLLEEQIGYGASGEVWRASDGSKVVAIKFMNERLMSGPNSQKHRERMQREINALESLDHPNLPKLYEADLDFSPPFLVMEYVGADSYDKLIDSGQILRIPLSRRLQNIQSLAYALHAAHTEGIIHRDIKPANIAGIEIPLLLDFSVAIEETDISGTRETIGTPGYMDPDPETKPDILGDIYSFAVVCFQILFRRHPAYIFKDRKLPPELAGTHPEQLNAVFAKGLGSRDQRYVDPRVFADELRKAVLLSLVEATQESVSSTSPMPHENHQPVEPSTDVGKSLGPETIAEYEPLQQPAQTPTIGLTPKVISFSSLYANLHARWKTRSADIQTWYSTWLLPHLTEWRRQFMALPQNTRIGISAGSAVFGVFVIFVLVSLLNRSAPNGVNLTQPIVINTLAPNAVIPTSAVANQGGSDALVPCTKEEIAAKIELAQAGVETNEEWEPLRCSVIIKGVEMALVPAGKFRFGNNELNDIEQHGTLVTMAPFWIAKYETTNKEFNEARGLESSDDNPDLPKEQISWEDAQIYCSNDKGMELPSEVQWEYAARGPNNWLYPWGDTSNQWGNIKGGLANYCDQSCKNLIVDKLDSSLNQYFRDHLVAGRFEDGFVGSAPVYAFEAGKSWVDVYNMAGNVSEWTGTIFQIKKGTTATALDDYPYDPFDRGGFVAGSEYVAIPNGREDPDRTVQTRVVRGGSYIALLNNPTVNLINTLNPSAFESVTTNWRQFSYQPVVQSDYFRIGVRCALRMSTAKELLGIT